MSALKLNEKTKWILILQGLILFLSFGGVLSKAAAQQEFLSWQFVALYVGEIMILFTYALMWQQVLKHIPLTVAFSNKSVGTVWSMLWGMILFNEVITLKMIIGAAIVIVGVLLVVKSDE